MPKTMVYNRKSGKWEAKKHPRGQGGKFKNSWWTKQGRKRKRANMKRRAMQRTHRGLRNAALLGGIATIGCGVMSAPVLLTIGVLTTTVVLGVITYQNRHWA